MKEHLVAEARACGRYSDLRYGNLFRQDYFGRHGLFHLISPNSPTTTMDANANIDKPQVRRRRASSTSQYAGEVLAHVLRLGFGVSVWSSNGSAPS